MAPEPDRTLFEELTVVIPSYRCDRFLPAAVESALHSSAARILIADDASGPDFRLAETFEEAHPGRVRVLRSKVRRGTATNINHAVRQVETRYFAKLDGDDVLVPGWLEHAFPFLASRPHLGLIAGRDRRIGAEEVLSFDPAVVRRASFIPTPHVMSGADAFRFILAWSPNPCSSGAIYRTEAFLDIGGFDAAIEWGEDWEIWLRFARNWEVAYCDSVSALYRIHAESTTAREIRQNRLCLGYEAVFRRAAEVCKDPSIQPLIRRAFLRVARLYAGAASREVRAFSSTSLRYGRYALRALITALLLAYVDR